MLHKAGQKKQGEHSSIRARRLSDYKYRKSLSDIGTSCYLTELPWNVSSSERQKVPEAWNPSLWGEVPAQRSQECANSSPWEPKSGGRTPNKQPRTCLETGREQCVAKEEHHRDVQVVATEKKKNHRDVQRANDMTLCGFTVCACCHTSKSLAGSCQETLYSHTAMTEKGNTYQSSCKPHTSASLGSDPLQKVCHWRWTKFARDLFWLQNCATADSDIHGS